MTLLAHPLFKRLAGGLSPGSLERRAVPPSLRWASQEDPGQALHSQLLAVQHKLRPGFMTLRAIHGGGRIVDFVWSFASTAAGRMLGRDAVELYGKRLRTVLAGQDGCEALFEQYRRVVELGVASAMQQVHQTAAGRDTYRHGAVRVGDGVAVTLINVSAARRAQALELALRAQQAMIAAYAR